jgi:predicted O-linked N-acetylglucosamine transferase (SPINDLY family)
VDRKNHLFILSPQYGGSTLLRRIISTSPAVATLPGEGQKMPGIWEQIRERRWDPDFTLPWAEIRRIWTAHWDPEKPIMLDKSPSFLMHADGLAAHFSPAYFLVMVRNPYALCEGLMRRNGWSAAQSVAHVVRCLQQQAENVRRLERVLSFTYEELVADPDAVCARISAFLPEVGTLHPHRTFALQSIDGIVEREIVDLNPKKIARLSADSVGIINEVLEKYPELMRYWGYAYHAPHKAAPSAQVAKWIAVTRENLKQTNPKVVALSLQTAQKALAMDPENGEAHLLLARTYHKMGRQREAEAWVDRVLALPAPPAEARVRGAMLQLPMIVRRPSDAARAKRRYRRYLERLITETNLENGRELAATATALAEAYPFFLSYLGGNVRELQEMYGNFLHAVMRKHHQAAITEIPTQPAAKQRRIRIGIPFGNFGRHANWFVNIKGYLSQLDRERFHITGYHLSRRDDEETALARDWCAEFVERRPWWSVDEWIRRIQANQHDILLYPEIKMHSLARRLAALRLAPVQVATWGQPYTTGLPTIDYFLSSDRIEPAGAQAHYSEKLIRLPGLSVHYIPTEPLAEPLPRAHFGLRDDAVVYACMQSIWKYQPQHDYLFARIARQVPAAQFVFLAHKRSAALTAIVRERLRAAFAAEGLDAAQQILLLPYQTDDEYHSLLRCCDVYLDSVAWGGMATVFEALATDPPIVTQTGDNFRGRVGAGILREMGVTETIAETLDEYIAIAVRLGRDPAYRRHIRAKMAASKGKAYRDEACIQGLALFFTEVVDGATAVRLQKSQRLL